MPALDWVSAGAFKAIALIGANPVLPQATDP